MLLIASMAAPALANQKAWSRQFVGETALSLSLPEKLGKPIVEEVKEKDDWVAKTEEYVFSTDRLYVVISVLSPRSGTSVNDKLMQKVIGDVLIGLTEGETSKADQKSNPTKISIDKKSGFKLVADLGEGTDQYQAQVLTIADGKQMYLIIGVGFTAMENSVADLNKIIGSIRLTKNLKG